MDKNGDRIPASCDNQTLASLLAPSDQTISHDVTLVSTLPPKIGTPPNGSLLLGPELAGASPSPTRDSSFRTNSLHNHSRDRSISRAKSQTSRVASSLGDPDRRGKKEDLDDVTSPVYSLVTHLPVLPFPPS